jgi:serine/threonine protein kinase
MGELLGEGTYSQVKLAVDNVTKEKVAVKIVNRVGIDPSDEQDLRNEVQILKELDHPNITKLYEFFEEPKSFYVVLEFLEGGELFDRIVKKVFYNEKEARDLVFILLKSIKYLHDKGIVHRDLKPEALLLKSKDNDAEVTLAGLHFATYSNGDDLTISCGTPGYIAPEILKLVPYGKTVDMWSFGVILYVLLGGYPPFHDEDHRALYMNIKKGNYEFDHKYWSGVSDEAKALIQGLLTVDPKLVHSLLSSPLSYLYFTVFVPVFAFFLSILLFFAGTSSFLCSFLPSFFFLLYCSHHLSFPFFLPAHSLTRLLSSPPRHPQRLTVDQALAHPWLGKSEEALTSTDLTSNVKVMKKYIATRKLKKVAAAIIAVDRMSRLSAGAREAAAEVKAEEGEKGAEEGGERETRT